MSFPAVLALLAAAVGAYVGLLIWRFRSAPGLQDLGWFAAVALSGAAYTSLNVAITSPAMSDATILVAARLQAFFVLAHAVAWFRYASAFTSRPWPREVPVTWGLLGAAAAALALGLGFADRVLVHRVGALDLTFRDAAPSALGTALMLLSLVTFLAVAARFVAAWRRGVPRAGLHVAVFAVLLAMGVNDGLVMLELYPGFYMVDLGFLGPVAAITYTFSGRVVAESRALADLRGQLERAVAERTAELERSREALFRAEKLAALGQFSAGVSHEVSNPAAVLAANLRYLEESLLAGGAPADAAECLAESREAVERISRLTRQLLDASRLASAPSAQAARVEVREVVDEALARLEPRLAGRPVEVQVEGGLYALGQQQALAQVLDRLLDNAVRSLRPGAGRLAVTGERALGRARLVVEDDGVGMTEATLGRAFDPFFSTRAFGTGKGMGLAVARGLVQSMRGDLMLESAPGRGTRAILELPLAEHPAEPRPLPAVTPP